MNTYIKRVNRPHRAVPNAHLSRSLEQIRDITENWLEV